MKDFLQFVFLPPHTRMTEGDTQNNHHYGNYRHDTDENYHQNEAGVYAGRGRRGGRWV